MWDLSDPGVEPVSPALAGGFFPPEPPGKPLLYLLFFLIFMFIYLAALGLSCGMWDLVPWPGIELGRPALGAWSLSHWTTREAPSSGTFQMTQLFTSGGQSIGVSASTSVLSMNTQDRSPL